MSQQHNPDTFLIKTVEDLKEFFGYANSHSSDIIAVDVETNHKQEKRALLWGISLALDENEAFYIPIRTKDGKMWWSDKVYNKLSKELYSLLSKKKVINHNIIYDVLVLKNNLGWDITEFIHADTILMKHLLDEEKPFGLKDVAVKYLGSWANKAQERLFENIKLNGGKTTKEQMDMYLADTDVLGEYSCWDVILVHLLFNKFDKEIKEQELDKLFYEDEIMPLYKEAVIPMKDKGFYVDVPYFEKLLREIESDIDSLRKEIETEIKPLVKERETFLLNKKYPVKQGGDFPKALAKVIGMPVVEVDGKVKLSKPALRTRLQMFRDEMSKEEIAFAEWFTHEEEIPLPDILTPHVELTQKIIHLGKGGGELFSITSNHDLIWLFFTKLGMTPEEFTEKGQPKLDAETLEGLSGQHPFADRIIEFKKLIKLKSTYIEGILELQVDGIIYTSFLMFGTTSGRFSSKAPNCQNLPKVKDEESNLTPLVLKYTNAIRRGFISPSGYKLVDADYSQLEVMAFGATSGDKKLQDVLSKGYDIYSAVAIEIWGLHEYSADKKAINYLKNHKPNERQGAKSIALGIVYGASAGKVKQILNCSFEEAQNIIDNYLDSYPGLKDYMSSCDRTVKNKGYVRTRFGRIRHITEAKELHSRFGDKLLDYRFVRQNGMKDLGYKYKSLLNNAKNFPIQGLAAHIVNRAMIQIAREFKRNNIDGWICAQVHDQITCTVREDHVDLAKRIVQDAMENTTKIEIPLVAEPQVATNWADSH